MGLGDIEIFRQDSFESDSSIELPDIVSHHALSKFTNRTAMSAAKSVKSQVTFKGSTSSKSKNTTIRK